MFHLIVSLVLVASGCRSNTISTLEAEDVLAMNAEARNRPYVLGLGDTVTVKFLYNNELNDEVTIRPDGKISLSMLGDLTAAGLSPVELDSVLTDLYRESLSIIGQGNEMSIRVAGTEAFDSTAVVSEKGVISLQGVGDIHVEGLSVAKLEALLAERYSDFVESPKVVVTPKSTKMVEITVGVKRSAGQKVYVCGEVLRAGMMPIDGRLTALEAVIQAGGPADTAELSQAVLVRRADTGEPEAHTLDLRAIRTGKIPDIRLCPYDVVYLPRTPIAELGVFMRQYVHSILPVQFTFVYNVNPEVKVK
jgi:polysaccharide export outer membrane protein